MYKQTLILSLSLFLQACATNAELNKQIANEYYEAILADNKAKIEVSIDTKKKSKQARLELFKNNNLKQIQKNNSIQQYELLESQIRKVTMDLLANFGNDTDILVLVNPLTLIDIESTAYTLERSTMLNSFIIQELLEFGISVVNDTVFDQAGMDLDRILILDTQIQSYQDKYHLTYYLKHANTNFIYATVNIKIPSLLLENSKDGVQFFN